MKTIHRSLSAIFLLWLGVPAFSTAAGTEAARTFVQATILGSNPARATLTFLDASGRQRVERVSGEAAASLAALRPGDQAILSLSTEAGGSVVTRVRVHRAVPQAAAPSATTPSMPVAGSSMPLKRSWPNPYAKGNRAAGQQATSAQ